MRNFVFKFWTTLKYNYTISLLQNLILELVYPIRLLSFGQYVGVYIRIASLCLTAHFVSVLKYKPLFYSLGGLLLACKPIGL